MPLAQVFTILELLDRGAPDSRELAGRIERHLAHNVGEELEFERDDLTLLWHALRDADLTVDSGPFRLTNMLRTMADDGAIG
jgi:hypothetical protein